MERLKFRAWHKTFKQYFAVEGINFVDCLISISKTYNNSLFSFDEVIIEQFTGLKDKNGKEIYEGDIIIYDFTRYVAKEPVMGVVKYSAESAAYGIVPLAYKDSMEWFGELAINAPLEVIGNIHEEDK